MKLMKKVLAGALSLAVVLGAMFAFTGCNSVRNKTYAVEGYTVTLVKAVDEETGEVTETQTITFREYYIHKYCGEDGVKLEDVATYTMTSEEKEEYNEAFKAITTGRTAEFSKDEVVLIQEEYDEFSGITTIEKTTSQYEVKDNVITIVYHADTNEELHNINSYVQFTMDIVDGKIHQKTLYDVEGIDFGYQGPTTEWEKGDVYYATVVYAEVK